MTFVSGCERTHTKRLLALSLFLLSAIPALATEQIPDKIIMEGEKHTLLSPSPFEYAISDVQIQSVRKRVQGLTPGCTANWRGYVATWEVSKERLLLRDVDISDCGTVPKLVPLSLFFANHDGPVDATWYSGTLLVGKGKANLVHEPRDIRPNVDRVDAYGRRWRYEAILKLTVERGEIISQEAL